MPAVDAYSAEAGQVILEILGFPLGSGPIKLLALGVIVLRTPPAPMLASRRCFRWINRIC